MRGLVALAGTILAAGCAPTEATFPPELRNANVERLSVKRFAVSLEAHNVDGYEMARCIAAAYTATLTDENGTALYHFFVRDGGRMTDEYRRVDGERWVTTRGVQTYSFGRVDELPLAVHDGRDLMMVDRQLANCEKAGLPTTLGGAG